MDWSNERYVRVYTRDTSDLLVIQWSGRALLWEMIRKADRAGIVDSDEPEVLAELLRMPLDVVSEALPRLLERECVTRATVEGRTVLLIRNYIDAQESAQTDKHRQRESRARRNERAKSQHVTICDMKAENVTKRDAASQNVTSGTENSMPLSQHVTMCHSVPSLAVPSRAEPYLGDADSPDFNDYPAIVRSHIKCWTIERTGMPPAMGEAFGKAVRTIATWLGDADDPEAVMAQVLEGFARDAKAQAAGYPVGWLAANPNQYLAKTAPPSPALDDSPAYVREQRYQDRKAAERKAAEGAGS